MDTEQTEKIEKEVEFIPLLIAMTSQMASRRFLREYGVTDAMLTAAETRGEVIISGPGLFDSVFLTDAGAALYPNAHPSAAHKG